MRTPAREPEDAAERWERIAGLFERALELSPDDRGGWLLAEVGEEPAVLHAVRRMLAADAEQGGLLDEGLAAVAPLALEPELFLTPGTRVGAFDIVGELGRGGMGVVYAGRDRHLDRPVALKFVRARPHGERGETEALLAEAKAASALDHPNVASVYQVGETEDGRYFIAMPRYDGETLRSRIERGPVPPPEALPIIRQIAAGLAAAHRIGIVHRDVTPNNVFLTSDGQAKLLDFGIASLVGRTGPASGAPGTFHGTKGYMSPERAVGMDADARSDVWSLGAILYRMLTGELPVEGAKKSAAVPATGGMPGPAQLVKRSDIPANLAGVLERALTHDPAGRYADAGQMLRALDQLEPARRGMRLGLMLATVLTVGALLVLTLPVESESDWPAGPSAGRTVAILPATPTDTDSADAYLAVGMTDRLTDRLAQLRHVRVKGPRTVSGSGTNLRSPPPAVGRALGVDYVVASEFQRADSLLVVSLRLFDAREGFQVWTDDYAVGADGLLVLQDSIVRDVARAVAGELSAEERAALGARLTSSPLAYDHFLRANYLLGKRTPASVRDAEGEYLIAIDSDPRFAEALAGQAYARLLFLDWGWSYAGHTRGELLEVTRALVERALELDPGSARVWLARAYERVVTDPIRFSGALDAFERSLRIDSLNPEARHQHGQTLMLLGRYEEAKQEYLGALQLEPARPMTLVPLAAIAQQMGQPEEALRWADSAVATTTSVPAPYALAVRASIVLQQGDPAAARRDAERALELDDSYPPPALSVLAVALSRLGQDEEARAVLHQTMETIDPAEPTPTDARFVSSALFALGRVDDALTLIERARPRGAQLWFYLQSRDFDSYRSLPRFHAVEREADPRADAERTEPPVSARDLTGFSR